MEGDFTIASGHDGVYSFDGGSPGAVSSVVSSPTETCPGSGLSVNEESWLKSVGLFNAAMGIKTATDRLPVAPKGDPVDHPEHYTAGKVEVIDILEQAVQDAPDPISGGLLWQTLKYLLRLWYKGNMLQDAKKARWYLNRLIERLERDYV
jgi:hypothetical protein